MQDLLSISPYMHLMTEFLKNGAEEDGYFPLTHFKLPESSGNIYSLISLNGVPIGFGMIRGWDEKWDDKCLGVFISKEMRGLGFGEALCKELIRAGKNRGLDKLRIHVSPENTRALNLYNKLGFVVEGTSANDERICYLYYS